MSTHTPPFSLIIASTPVCELRNLPTGEGETEEESKTVKGTQHNVDGDKRLLHRHSS